MPPSSESWKRLRLLLLASALLCGCAGLPPGAAAPREKSFALAHPEQTRIGGPVDAAAHAHSDRSGFHLLQVGLDGFLARMQMVHAAERTLDLQYYIFRQDETGRLLSEALLRAADRGVRVRILVDDGDVVDGDEQLALLDAHPNIEVRVFNPFAYRGHAKLLRGIEFAFNARRLDYRMHNKLLAADNAIALVGGRNIGDQYFQVDPESQFGDDDVFVAGPVTQQLTRTFDDFWNSDLAIPVAALGNGKPQEEALAGYRRALEAHRKERSASGQDYDLRIASGEPLAGMLAGRLPLVWATARMVFDSPDKRQVERHEATGRLMHPAVAEAAAATHSELLMITPFLIPGTDGMTLLSDLRQRGVQVRILTNSLASTPELLAHSGYMHYRRPLLERGVQLYEVRARLGNARGSGESRSAIRSGNYGLHAKLFVFDRERLYIGSMNFDQRSQHLNTEVGLLIDSSELAREAAERFQSMVAPANSYRLSLRSQGPEATAELVWHTQEAGREVDTTEEPARTAWQRLQARFYALLPLDDEL